MTTGRAGGFRKPNKKGSNGLVGTFFDLFNLVF